MSAISGEPDGVRPRQTSAVGQLTPRDWVVVAAGAVAVVGTFLPWYGFSLPTVSYSVSGFSAHGPVPMAPLTLVPALSGLVAAGQRLLPLARNAGAGAPAGSKKSSKKTVFAAGAGADCCDAPSVTASADEAMARNKRMRITWPFAVCPESTPIRPPATLPIRPGASPAPGRRRPSARRV